MVVGFCGSRSLPVAFAPLVASVVSSFVVGGSSVCVGCATGADAFVRSTCPSALVFRAASFGSGPSSLVARSVALVRHVASQGGSLVGFVSSPCPVGVAPVSSWCGGSGSGSWASLALAVGLGCPVSVCWCSPAPVALPAWAGGAWVACSRLPGQSFVWQPAPVASQLSLF